MRKMIKSILLSQVILLIPAVVAMGSNEAPELVEEDRKELPKRSDQLDAAKPRSIEDMEKDDAAMQKPAPGEIPFRPKDQQQYNEMKEKAQKEAGERYPAGRGDGRTNQSKTLQGRDKCCRKGKFFQKREKADKGGLSPEYKKGEIFVKFKDGVSESEADSVHKGVGATVRKKFKKSGVHLVQLPEGKDTQEAIDDYKKTTKVEYAEPNYRVSVDSTD